MTIRDYALAHLNERKEEQIQYLPPININKETIDNITGDQVYSYILKQLFDNKTIPQNSILTLKCKKENVTEAYFFLSKDTTGIYLTNSPEAGDKLSKDFQDLKDKPAQPQQLQEQTLNSNQIKSYFDKLLKKYKYKGFNQLQIAYRQKPKEWNGKNPHELNKTKQEAQYKQNDSVLKQSIKDGIAEGMNTTYFKESVDRKIQEAKSSINLNPYKSVEMAKSIGTGYTASPDVRVGQDSTLGQASQQTEPQQSAQEEQSQQLDFKQKFIAILQKYQWGIDGAHGMPVDNDTNNHFNSQNNTDYVSQIINQINTKPESWFDEKGLIKPEPLTEFFNNFGMADQGGARLYLHDPKETQALGGQQPIADKDCLAAYGKVSKNIDNYSKAYKGNINAKLSDACIKIASSRRLFEYFFGNQGKEQLLTFLNELNQFIKENFENCSNSDEIKTKKELYAAVTEFLNTHHSIIDGDYGTPNISPSSNQAAKIKSKLRYWFNKAGLIKPAKLKELHEYIFNPERADRSYQKREKKNIDKLYNLITQYEQNYSKLPQQLQEAQEKEDQFNRDYKSEYAKLVSDFANLVSTANTHLNNYLKKLNESTNLFMNLPQKLRESVARLFEDATLDMEKYRKAFERQYHIDNWIDLESESGNLSKDDAIDCINAAKSGDSSAKYYLLYKAGPVLKQVYQRNFLGSDKSKASRNGKNAEDFMTLAAISLDQGYGTGASKVTGGEKKQEGALESFDPSKLRSGVSAIAAFMNIYRMVLTKGCQEYNAQDNNRGIVKDIVNKENKNEFTDIDAFGEENRSLPSQMQITDGHQEMYSNEFLDNWKDFAQDWEMNKAKSGRTPAQVLKHFLKHPGATNMRDLADDFGISRGGYLAMINKAIEVMDDYYIEPDDFREMLGEFGGEKLASYLRESRRAEHSLNPDRAEVITALMEKYHLIPTFKPVGYDGHDFIITIENGGATSHELKDSILGDDPSFKSFAKEFNEVIDYDDIVVKPVDNYATYEIRIVRPEVVKAFWNLRKMGLIESKLNERKYDELDKEDLQKLVQRVVAGFINYRNKNPSEESDWTNMIAREIDMACPEWDHPKNFKQKAFNMVKDALEPMGFQFKKRRSYSFQNIF